MCRLFGFRASFASAVHRSLVHEQNALRRQSREHPDGWGLAFYVGGQPQVARGVDCAFEDEDFDAVSEFITSDTVVAHVRKASVGALRLENTHPFEHGPWVMAHNGTIAGFDAVRARLEQRLAPEYQGRLRGDTDSERLFALFLSHLAERADPMDRHVPLGPVLQALDRTVRETVSICAGAPAAPSLNLLVTNGRVMAVSRLGRTLFLATHKRSCRARETCPHFTAACVEPAQEDRPLTHFLVASEQIGADPMWEPLQDGDLAGVDGQLRLQRARLGALRDSAA